MRQTGLSTIYKLNKETDVLVEFMERTYFMKDNTKKLLILLAICVMSTLSVMMAARSEGTIILPVVTYLSSLGILIYIAYAFPNRSWIKWSAPFFLIASLMYFILYREAVISGRVSMRMRDIGVIVLYATLFVYGCIASRKS